MRIQSKAGARDLVTEWILQGHFGWVCLGWSEKIASGDDSHDNMMRNGKHREFWYLD